MWTEFLTAKVSYLVLHDKTFGGDAASTTCAVDARIYRHQAKNPPRPTLTATVYLFYRETPKSSQGQCHFPCSATTANLTSYQTGDAVELAFHVLLFSRQTRVPN
jgi:hypothetical protein